MKIEKVIFSYQNQYEDKLGTYNIYVKVKKIYTLKGTLYCVITPICTVCEKKLEDCIKYALDYCILNDEIKERWEFEHYKLKEMYDAKTQIIG